MRAIPRIAWTFSAINRLIDLLTDRVGAEPTCLCGGCGAAVISHHPDDPDHGLVLARACPLRAPAAFAGLWTEAIERDLFSLLLGRRGIPAISPEELIAFMPAILRNHAAVLAARLAA